MKGSDEFTDNGKPEMHINLMKNIFFPGETIKGKIFLRSGNFFEKGVINYNIFGHEKITEMNKNKIECNNSTKIYHASLEYPGLINYSLSKGIEIPFTITLPSYILPSFEYSINNNYGYIKNYLHVEIPELNLVKEKFIIIRRPNIKLNTPLVFKSEKNEKLYGIFNKGCPILKTSFDKNYYYFNEEIVVKICFNHNNSKFNVKNVNVKLIRNIIFKLKENHENQNIIFLYNKNKENIKIDDIIYCDELFYESINLYEKIDINNENKDINFDVKFKLEEPEKIFNKNNVPYLNLGLLDKSNLILFLPSFESSLFKCEYLIKIEAIYDTILPIQNIIINMPISVYHNYENQDNEYNLFNFNNDNNININEDNGNNDGLIDKPREEKENNKENNKDNNKEIIKEKKKEDEVKTYRNDEEKEWNNITNGQIIPELMPINNDNEKNK